MIGSDRNVRICRTGHDKTLAGSRVRITLPCSNLLGIEAGWMAETRSFAGFVHESPTGRGTVAATSKGWKILVSCNHDVTNVSRVGHCPDPARRRSERRNSSGFGTDVGNQTIAIPKLADIATV